jgi:hypothetical protein
LLVEAVTSRRSIYVIDGRSKDQYELQRGADPVQWSCSVRIVRTQSSTFFLSQLRGGGLFALYSLERAIDHNKLEVDHALKLLSIMAIELEHTLPGL